MAAIVPVGIISAETKNVQQNERHKIPACVAVIIRKCDEILLLKRANAGWLDGYWGMPGGSLEKDESLAEATARETQEEVGIQINPKDLELVHMMHIRRGGRKDFFGFMFLAHVWKGEAANGEPHKCSEVRWFPINDLPLNVIPQTLEAYKLAQKGIRYSEPTS